MDCGKIKDLLSIPLLECKEHNGLIILETKIILPDGDNLTIAYDTTAQNFTDLGETLAKLAVNGIDLRGTKEEVFNSYLTHYGVRLCEGEMRSNEPLPLIQMIIHAHDLSWLSRWPRKEGFIEEIKHFLNERRVEYTPNVLLADEGGRKMRIHFEFPKYNKRLQSIWSRTQIERTAYLLFMAASHDGKYKYAIALKGEPFLLEEAATLRTPVGEGAKQIRAEIFTFPEQKEEMHDWIVGGL